MKDVQKFVGLDVSKVNCCFIRFACPLKKVMILLLFIV